VTLSPSHWMGHHLYLEAMIPPSNSGIYRLVGLSKPSKVILLRFVNSVSISADCTTIASGSLTMTLRLWTFRQGSVSHYTTTDLVNCVHFFPLDPQHLISISGSKVLAVEYYGHQIAPTYDGSYAAFSLDGTQFALYNGAIIQVRSSNSRAVTAEFNMGKSKAKHCCFSPDGRLVAVAAGPLFMFGILPTQSLHSLRPLLAILMKLSPLHFPPPPPSSQHLWDKSVKFWQIGTSSTDSSCN
jgi:WD40 repeat protein